jgi:glutamyl-tRNA synthetase
MVRVRFAPSPTGFLHIGSARTFIFNWLFARKNNGTILLRIDDTDAGRNTDASLASIFEGLDWLELGWDEMFRQSDRLATYREAAEAILAKGMAYRDFTPASQNVDEKAPESRVWAFNFPDRDLSPGESARRAAAGEPFVVRFRVPRGGGLDAVFDDLVYGGQSKSLDEIEDFALLRSNGMPTYHLASCVDDAARRITHVIRGQDHLTNTFKHILLFEALGCETPAFAHLPLLIAPDGSKLSKRRHGAVVSVTTYRDAGFLPHAYVNFLCLLGWSPKDDREVMSRQNLIGAFSLDNVNRSNAIVNFSAEDPIDPKALWLNAQHIYALPPEDLARRLQPFLEAAGHRANPAKVLAATPLIQERIKTLRDAAAVADFFFLDELPPYDRAELVPQKGDVAMALSVLETAREVLERTEFNHQPLDAALRAAAASLGIKPGQMFQPIRVAVCGRKVAPPLFETLEVLGRETCLKRLERAIGSLR